MPPDGPAPLSHGQPQRMADPPGQELQPGRSLIRRTWSTSPEDQAWLNDLIRATA